MFGVIPVFPIRTLGWKSLSIACRFILSGMSLIFPPPIVLWSTAEPLNLPTF